MACSTAVLLCCSLALITQLQASAHFAAGTRRAPGDTQAAQFDSHQLHLQVLVQASEGHTLNVVKQRKLQQADAPEPQPGGAITAVTTATGLQRAVIAGARHIVIQEHLDLTALSYRNVYVDSGFMSRNITTALGPLKSDTVSITGRCEEPPPPALQNLPGPEVRPLGAGQCIIAVDSTFAVLPHAHWLDNLFFKVLLRDRTVYSVLEIGYHDNFKGEAVSPANAQEQDPEEDPAAELTDAAASKNTPDTNLTRGRTYLTRSVLQGGFNTASGGDKEQVLWSDPDELSVRALMWVDTLNPLHTQFFAQDVHFMDLCASPLAGIVHIAGGSSPVMPWRPSRFVDCVFARNNVPPPWEGLVPIYNSILSAKDPTAPAWLQSCSFVNNTIKLPEPWPLLGYVYHQGLEDLGALRAADPPDKSIFLAATDQMIIDVAQVLGISPPNQPWKLSAAAAPEPTGAPPDLAHDAIPPGSSPPIASPPVARAPVTSPPVASAPVASPPPQQSAPAAAPPPVATQPGSSVTTPGAATGSSEAGDAPGNAAPRGSPNDNTAATATDQQTIPAGDARPIDSSASARSPASSDDSNQAAIGGGIAAAVAAALIAALVVLFIRRRRSRPESASAVGGGAKSARAREVVTVSGPDTAASNGFDDGGHAVITSVALGGSADLKKALVPAAPAALVIGQAAEHEPAGAAADLGHGGPGPEATASGAFTSTGADDAVEAAQDGSGAASANLKPPPQAAADVSGRPAPTLASSASGQHTTVVSETASAGVRSQPAGGTTTFTAMSATATGVYDTAVAAAETTVDQQKERLMTELDHMRNRNEHFLEQFAVLPWTERREGGQGVVQFMRSTRTEEAVAAKFFLSRTAFDTELKLYQVPVLRSMMPAVRVELGNADEAARNSRGYPWPPCIVLEKGESLQEWKAKTQPAFSTILDALCLITERLVQLHGAGWVHRDLKPGNVLRLPGQHSWTLMDFGCAARTGESVSLSFSPSYAPPEVAQAAERGDKTITAAASADMWALGVMAFELLTGAPLFPPITSSREAIWAQLCGRELLPWEEGAPGQAGKLAQLRILKRAVLHCLQRRPEDRPTAQEVVVHWRNLFESRTAAGQSL